MAREAASGRDAHSTGGQKACHQNWCHHLLPTLAPRSDPHPVRTRFRRGDGEGDGARGGRDTHPTRKAKGLVSPETIHPHPSHPQTLNFKSIYNPTRPCTGCINARATFPPTFCTNTCSPSWHALSTRSLHPHRPRGFSPPFLGLPPGHSLQVPTRPGPLEIAGGSYLYVGM